MRSNILDVLLAMFTNVGMKLTDAPQMILLIASIITLILWLTYLFRPKNTQDENSIFEKLSGMKTWFFIFTAILMLRTAIVEPFNLGESDFEPEVRSYSWTFVEKYSWGLRLPVLGRVVETREPKVNEIIMVNIKGDTYYKSVMRVIGRAGDKVVVEQNSCEILLGDGSIKKMKGEPAFESVDPIEFTIPENSLLVGYDSCHADLNEFLVVRKEDIIGSILFQI